MNFDSFTSINQRREYKGKVIPAFVKGFYNEIKVYEDGIIDCLNNVDFENFRALLNSNDPKYKDFVIPYLNNGEDLHVHNLGVWKISEDEWFFNKDTFYEHIGNIIKELNPDWQDIDKHVGMTRNVNFSDFYIFGEINSSSNENIGKSLYLSKEYSDYSFKMFYQKNKNEYYLVNLLIIEKSTIIDNEKSSILISGIDFPESITNNDFYELVEKGKLLCEVPENSVVKIYGLGKFKITKCEYAIETNQKVLEINDAIASINGQPCSRKEFYAKYEEYKNNPTDDLKKDLKIYFKKIPSHFTRYMTGLDGNIWKYLMNEIS